jgi:hypothetical protein
MPRPHFYFHLVLFFLTLFSYTNSHHVNPNRMATTPSLPPCLKSHLAPHM